MKLGVNGRFLGAPITGVQRFARELLQQLSTQADLTLLVPANTPIPDWYKGDVMRGRLNGHVWEQVELTGSARKRKCDVVLHPANTVPFQKHRSVVVVHDPLFPLTHPEWFTQRYALWQKHWIAPALRRTTSVLTVSDWSRRHLAGVLDIPIDRISVVPQGLGPFDAPAAASAVERVRKHFALPDRYLIAFGGRTRVKNIRFLEPVLAELAQLRGEVVPLVVVGDSHPRVHRPDEAVAESKYIRLFGHVGADDTHALLTGAAALCFPSLAEGFGRPPLEAIACGTPALVSAYDAASEVLADAGWILPYDTSAWSAALHQVLDDPTAKTRMLDRADRLRARYTWSHTGAVVMEACEKAARVGAGN